MSHPSYHELFPGGVDLIHWPHKHPLPEAEVIAFFESRHLSPSRWLNGPGEIYSVHTHSYRKTLFCIQGSIVFTLPDLDRTIELRPGDRLIIPAGVPHGATVGPDGVVCIEAGT
ncbi:MAG: cupin domain-containing protein [Candidatus Manganitrophaceae bacterium]